MVRRRLGNVKAILIKEFLCPNKIHKEKSGKFMTAMRFMFSDGVNRCPDCSGSKLNLDVLNNSSCLREAIQPVLNEILGQAGTDALMFDKDEHNDIVGWISLIMYDGFIQILKDLKATFTSKSGPWEGRDASEIARLVNSLMKKQGRGYIVKKLASAFGCNKKKQQKYGVKARLLKPLEPLLQALKDGKASMCCAEWMRERMQSKDSEFQEY